MSTTTTSKRAITNARILLGLDGFGPVTIEDWRSLGPSVARALIAATDDVDRLTDEVKRLNADLDVISVGRADAVIEIDRLTAELEEARTKIAKKDRIIASLDCRYAGDFAELSGSHCPLDRPCARCEAEAALAAAGGAP